jgi:subtilisin family serine protease
MHRPRRLTVALACAAGLALACATNAVAASGPYVVVYKDTVLDSVATTSQLEIKYGFNARFDYSSALKGFAATLSDTQRTALAADPAVAYVATDKTVNASGLVPVASGETVPPGIRRVGAATLTQAHPAANGAVAVIDSGVDLSNTDLNAVSGTNCVTIGATAKDDNGHGTNVAGILAAKNTGTNLTGVAPGTKVYAVKVLNSRATGTLSQIICGMDWVTANAAALNIKVANMSIEGSGSNDNNCGNTNNDAWHKAICRSVAAGVTYVVSAGNSKASFASTIPAAYPEVLTTTAMSDTDGLAGAKGAAPTCKSGEKDDSYGTYSNYAVSSTDIAHTIAAPGTCVVGDKIGGGTTTYYGTSQATPHVAGTVALCLGSGGVTGPCSGLTPAQIVSKIRSDAAGYATVSNGFTGDPLHPLSGKYFGYLDAAALY